MHVRWPVLLVWSLVVLGARASQRNLMSWRSGVLEYCPDAASAVCDATQETVAQYH